MADVDPLAWLGPALDDLDARGLRRRPGHRETPTGRFCDGRVNLSSNDYLGLAGNPRLAAAAGEAAERWGAGSGASRLVTGGTVVHRRLEAAIAGWKGTQDAVLFSSGYLANVGTIGALVGPGDAIFSDALNHASIVDGCRLSRAQAHVYPHGDLDALDAALRRAPARRRLVVTDGVFSMDGDTADLPGLCAVAERHGAMVMVDDAHGCGVLGPDGRGTVAAQGVAEEVHVNLGTLSKAFGSAGGYVAGSRALCAWLRNRARAFVFDTAPPPPVAAAALEGLRLSVAEPWRRRHALDLARRLADLLALPRPDACIVPVVVGEADAALALSARFADAGVEVVAIRPPSVPEGTARLRFTTTAAHHPADLARVARVVGARTAAHAH